MKKITFLALVAFAFFLTSCDSNNVYKKFKKNFTDYRWEKSKVLEYSPVIQDANIDYQVYIAFRYIYGFPQESIDVNVEMTTPSGDVTTTLYTLYLRDGMEEYGVCAGDYCDLEQLILEDYKFPETGTYTFKITQATDDDPLQWVMEVGLIIDKVETE